ncbi:MAG: hypothetical protein RL637_1333 [Pseudomonadota bacterium]|jgi:hypothetical protein
MQTATFKDWTLNRLDKTFGLKQIWQSDLLNEWFGFPCEINENEQNTLLKLQKTIARGGQYWNEVELENKFISPLIVLADIDDENIGYFLERPLSAQIGDYQLSGIVDGMIATGFREPEVPLFCLHEYKRSMENQGAADAQVLAAMLVAREMNQNQKPIYGLYVVGLIWHFLVLEQNHYCISRTYCADNDDVFILFKMLKNVKQLIERQLSKE